MMRNLYLHDIQWSAENSGLARSLPRNIAVIGWASWQSKANLEMLIEQKIGVKMLQYKSIALESARIANPCWTIVA